MVSHQEWDESIFVAGSADGPEDLIFHYTSLERAASIALTGQILLSPLSVLNDPREAQQRATIRRTYGSLGEGPHHVTDEEGAAHDRALQAMRAQLRVACFTRDRRAEARTLADTDARGFTSPRMWAQYGGGNAGCCIAFRRDLVEAAAEAALGSPVFGPVAYVKGFDDVLHDAESADFNDPLTFEPGANIQAQHGRVIESLFSKNDDWSAEREYRIVVDWSSPDVCAIPVGDAICGVVLGPSFAPHLIPVAEALRERWSVADDQVALLTVDSGVLVPYPAVGPDGKIHRWTDADLRGGVLVFD